MATPAVSSPTEYAHIVRTPGVVGGEPRIDGHRIRVRDIAVARDLDGLEPQAIVQEAYPELTLAEVYAALAYYEDHRAEIEEAAQAEAAEADRHLQPRPAWVHDLRPGAA